MTLAGRALGLADVAAVDERDDARQRQRRLDALDVPQQRRLERHRRRGLGGVDNLEHELGAVGATRKFWSRSLSSGVRVAVEAEVVPQQRPGDVRGRTPAVDGG